MVKELLKSRLLKEISNPSELEIFSPESTFLLSIKTFVQFCESADCGALAISSTCLTQVTLKLMGHRVPLLFAYIRLELSPSNNNVFEH